MWASGRGVRRLGPPLQPYLQRGDGGASEGTGCSPRLVPQSLPASLAQCLKPACGVGSRVASHMGRSPEPPGSGPRRMATALQTDRAGGWCGWPASCPGSLPGDATPLPSIP